MTARIFLLIALLAAPFASVASAQEEPAAPKGVVELFTSQGCGSCPPADAVLKDLAGTDGVIALSYHVDYWNYLGWQDTLASKENTERQKAYARMLKRESVYTPQAILNGRQQANGAKRSVIDTELKAMRQRGEAPDVPIEIEHRGDSIFIRIDRSEKAKKANVLFVVYDRTNTVAVKAGENSGQTMHYVNSVRKLQPVGLWKGKQKTIELPATMVDWPRQGCAVLLQSMLEEDVPGPVIGAASLPAQ